MNPETLDTHYGPKELKDICGQAATQHSVFFNNNVRHGDLLEELNICPSCIRTHHGRAGRIDVTDRPQDSSTIAARDALIREAKELLADEIEYEYLQQTHTPDVRDKLESELDHTPNITAVSSFVDFKSDRLTPIGVKAKTASGEYVEIEYELKDIRLHGEPIDLKEDSDGPQTATLSSFNPEANTGWTVGDVLSRYDSVAEGFSTNIAGYSRGDIILRNRRRLPGRITALYTPTDVEELSEEKRWQIEKTYWDTSGARGNPHHPNKQSLYSLIRHQMDEAETVKLEPDCADVAHLYPNSSVSDRLTNTCGFRILTAFPTPPEMATDIDHIEDLVQNMLHRYTFEMRFQQTFNKGLSLYLQENRGFNEWDPDVVWNLSPTVKEEGSKLSFTGQVGNGSEDFVEMEFADHAGVIPQGKTMEELPRAIKKTIRILDSDTLIDMPRTEVNLKAIKIGQQSFSVEYNSISSDTDDYPPIFDYHVDSVKYYDASELEGTNE